MNVPAWVWLTTIGLAIVVFAIDIFVIARRPHVPSTREVGTSLGIYVGAAILFGNDGLQHDPPTKPDSIHGDGANGGERGREATLHVTGPASKNAAVMHRGRPRIRCPLP